MPDKPKSKLNPPFLHGDVVREPVAAEEPRSVEWAGKQLGAFDWKSAASLRASDKPGLKAERAWDLTDWVDPLSPVSDEARRVAAALEASIRAK